MVYLHSISPPSHPKMRSRPIFVQRLKVDASKLLWSTTYVIYNIMSSKHHAHMYCFIYVHVISYIIAAFYPELFSTIMGLAYDMGVAGENKLWLISGTADLAPFLLSGKFIIPKGKYNICTDGSLLFPSLNCFELAYYPLFAFDCTLLFLCRFIGSKGHIREWNHILQGRNTVSREFSFVSLIIRCTKTYNYCFTLQRCWWII